MHAAAIEQFLKIISRLQNKSAAGASIIEIAQANRIPQEQAQQVVQTLAERGLIRLEETGTISLTPYGVRRLMTEAIEDYLITIYRLSRNQNEDRVTTSAIAQALGVSAPSVTSMTQKKLSQFGLVDYERHRGVTLTPLGERIALQILRYHRIVELYLTKVLGLPWEQVHDEAHRLEHAMSPLLVERIATILGDPQVDPHGDPIPRQDGTIARADLAHLYDTPPGQTVVVRRVRDQSTEVLRYLGQIDLVPGTQVQVLARAPLDGPLTVRVGDSQHVLSRELAHVILVAPLQES